MKQGPVGDPIDAYDGGEEYRSPTVMAALGITYRMLDYWARTGLVVPSIAAAGSGTRRLYSFEDLVELAIVRELRNRGIELAEVRKGLSRYRSYRDARQSGLGLFIVSDPVRGWDVVEAGELDFGAVSVVTILSVDWIRLDVEGSLLVIEQAWRLKTGTRVLNVATV